MHISTNHNSPVSDCVPLSSVWLPESDPGVTSWGWSRFVAKGLISLRKNFFLMSHPLILTLWNLTLYSGSHGPNPGSADILLCGHSTPAHYSGLIYHPGIFNAANDVWCYISSRLPLTSKFNANSTDLNCRAKCIFRDSCASIILLSFFVLYLCKR